MVSYQVFLPRACCCFTFTSICAPLPSLRSFGVAAKTAKFPARMSAIGPAQAEQYHLLKVLCRASRCHQLQLKAHYLDSDVERRVF